MRLEWKYNKTVLTSSTKSFFLLSTEGCLVNKRDLRAYLSGIPVTGPVQTPWLYYSSRTDYIFVDCSDFIAGAPWTLKGWEPLLKSSYFLFQVPHKIHVVKEKRIYGSWGTDVDADSGIIKSKKAFNDLHKLLGNNGFNEVYVDQMDFDTVGVTRHCPITHQTVVMVAFTAFKGKVSIQSHCF